MTRKISSEGIAVNPEIETIQRALRDKAENLFEASRFCCSESVLIVLNEGLKGGLTREAALGMGVGFCGGIGGGGCLCGALAGSVMALGLFVGPHHPDGLNKRDFKKLTKTMHEQFQDRFGSTCCKALIKGYSKNCKSRRNYCRGITGDAIELVAGLLLRTRPELERRVDMEFLQSRDSKFSGLMKSIF